MRCQTPDHVFSTTSNQYEPGPLTCGGGSETETDAGTEDEETEDELPLTPIAAQRAGLRQESFSLETAGQSIGVNGVLNTLPLDIGIDGEDHVVHAHSVTDALAAFEELALADRSDEATSDEDEDDHGSTSSDPHAAPRPADHLDTLDMHLKRAKVEMMQKSSDLTKTYILADDYIKNASEALGLDLDQRVTECSILVNQKMMGHLYFYVLKHDFQDWMSNHARLLGVSFVHKETYEFRGNLNKIHGHLHRRSYSCNHAGKKYVKASEQDPNSSNVPMALRSSVTTSPTSTGIAMN
ncbi:hypothetical protein BGZ75_001500 [Mortierella antarctica]|nr:hypothetical protein BGZ75_001500 [Mortierella antarctica]